MILCCILVTRRGHTHTLSLPCDYIHTVLLTSLLVFSLWCHKCRPEADVSHSIPSRVSWTFPMAEYKANLKSSDEYSKIKKQWRESIALFRTMQLLSKADVVFSTADFPPYDLRVVSCEITTSRTHISGRSCLSFRPIVPYWMDVDEI
jgi:hypothetical protein